MKQRASQLQHLARTQQERGFTLVELLIVIVIIAILSGITVVAYRSVTSQANASAIQAELSQVGKRLASYYAENGDYPASLAMAGVKTGQVGYQYSFNNTSSPATFGVTGIKGTVSYFISNTQPNPQIGGYDGHNYYSSDQRTLVNIGTYPGCEITPNSMWRLYYGTTWERVASPSASDGSYVCRFTRGTTGSNLMSMYFPIAMPADQTFSYRLKIRLTDNTPATNTVRLSANTYIEGSGTGTALGCTQPTIQPVKAPQWTDVVVTGCRTPNLNMNNIGIQIWPVQEWQPTDGYEVDSMMVVREDTIGNYADGNTPGWAWIGTPNASMSVGPPP